MVFKPTHARLLTPALSSLGEEREKILWDDFLG